MHVLSVCAVNVCVPVCMYVNKMHYFNRNSETFLFSFSFYVNVYGCTPRHTGVCGGWKAFPRTGVADGWELPCGSFCVVKDSQFVSLCLELSMGDC